MTQGITANAAVSSSSVPGRREDDDYRALHEHLSGVFLGKPEGTLYTTDAEGLFDAFLAALPVERRGHYVCIACRRFVEGFGGLVTIDESGATASPLWEGWEPPPFFGESVRAMARLVRKARVTGVFVHDERIWGRDQNSSNKAPGLTWHHMHVVAHTEMIHDPGPMLTTPGQYMAERKADHGMLCRGLAEYPLDVVKRAHTMLTTDALYRSEKCIGVAQWLLDLHEAREATKNRAVRENLIWRAVASAPAGFCHVRSTMISTLLDDIVAGKPFASIKRSFDAKMAPTQYQRPQAAPTDGQLAAAEALVAKLRSAGSLSRRRASIEEVLPHAIWTPRPTKRKAAPKEEEVFGHLKSKKSSPAPSSDLPVQTITWEKFARTVLPEAEEIECLVPSASRAFFGFVTATNPHAPPILQWDSEERRNPVSWYLHTIPTNADMWSLRPDWSPIAAITLQPSSWTSELEHQGNGIYFVLREARPQLSVGLALFPEILRVEYRGIRAAIEAYSSRGKLDDVGLATPACGLCMQKATSGAWNQIVRVTARGTKLAYRFDRWD